MFALIDCNSFFCSAEQARRGLPRGSAVCVLGSGDGCIVALTPEAKAVGLRRGDPFFQVEGTVRHYGVHVFSADLHYYRSVSQQIVGILREVLPNVEQYSIDESFCDLTGLDTFHDVEDLVRRAASRVLAETGVPVSCGIAPTRTLAKIGSKFAKQYEGYRSVCVIDTDAKRVTALRLFPLKDVWGIGRRTLRTLEYCGVTTTDGFASQTEAWVSAHFARPVVDTWRELRGIPCVDISGGRFGMGHDDTGRQSISRTRTFTKMIEDFDGLHAAVSGFVSHCAAELRAERQVAAAVTVFVATNPRRLDLRQYQSEATAVLPVATADTIELTAAAVSALRQVYRGPGLLYKRAGVMLSRLAPATPLRQDLFDNQQHRNERMRLMRAVDDINARLGRDTVTLATTRRRAEKNNEDNKLKAGLQDKKSNRRQ